MIPATLLKEARTRAGLTQAELGDRTGYSGAEISRWERGKVSLTFERLEGLIEGCGLELDIALRPLDRSQYVLMRGNVGRSPRQRLRGLRRHLRQTAEIQGRDENFDPERLLVALADARVDFIVIGGVAAVLWGSPYPTENLDLMIRAGVRNQRRFQSALRGLVAKWPAGDEGVQEYATRYGLLRVIAEPVSMPSYQTLRRRSPAVELSGVEIRVAPLADVIRSAEARPRPKRRAEILALRRLATEIAPSGRLDQAQL